MIFKGIHSIGRENAMPSLYESLIVKNSERIMVFSWQYSLVAEVLSSGFTQIAFHDPKIVFSTKIFDPRSRNTRKKIEIIITIFRIREIYE